MKLVYNNDYIDLLQRSENDLLHSLNGLSKERFYFKPAKNKWSIYECLLHILISEKNITKIIKIDSYSSIPLKQKTGMEKIIEYMENPESYIAPEMTLPNEANIKNLFENNFSEEAVAKNDIIEEPEAVEEKASAKRSLKTYDVIFGSKGSRNFREDKRIYADSSKESFLNKESSEKTKDSFEKKNKNITNPFAAKFMQQPEMDLPVASNNRFNDEVNNEVIEELSSEGLTDKISLRSYSHAYVSALNSTNVPVKNIKELMNLFISIRDELINYFLLNPDVSLNTFYFAHPELGDLTKEEWLFYLVSHTNRHRKQVENIKIHLPFAI